MDLPDIAPLDTRLSEALQKKIDSKTKPLGSLGELEQMARRLGLIQKNLTPQITQPTILVFAADHGVVASGVSPYPPEVTRQMVQNFLSGGAAINSFCKLHGLDLRIIDCGVKGGPFPSHEKLISSRRAEGTRNLLEESAMSTEEAIRCLERGAQIARAMTEGGCNTIGFGEMGIGNTTSSAVIMAALTGLSPEECTGRGTGLDDAGLKLKTLVVEKALKRIGQHPDPLEILAQTGGFEIAHMAGAMIGTAYANGAVVVDGFVSSAAWLLARTLRPAIVDYTFFAHCSAERGHRKLLETVGAIPLLQLSMRLGEGTGAALAIPLLRAACTFLNDMSSFETAGVSKQVKVEAASSRLKSTISGKMPLLLSKDNERYFDPFDKVMTTRANLPHWQQDSVLYFVTFRLTDSLPKQKIIKIEQQRLLWLQLNPPPLSEEKEKEYWRLFGGRMEQLLDEGYGSCVLKQKHISKIVEEALLKFDKVRYDLGSWVIMPNHVHVLVRPRKGYPLSKILHSWKSFTATKINKLLNRSRPLWQKESYDHIVRSESAQKRIEKYIDESPKKARIKAASSRLFEQKLKRQDAASTLCGATK